ncbi:MAG: hypothetical protein ACR2HL_08590 [Methylocystis sp.]
MPTDPPTAFLYQFWRTYVLEWMAASRLALALHTGMGFLGKWPSILHLLWS